MVNNEVEKDEKQIIEDQVEYHLVDFEKLGKDYRKALDFGEIEIKDIQV